MTGSVSITEHGRDGRIVYRESSGEQSFYWELGGGDVIAIVHGGAEAQWRESAPWAADRRAEILRFVAAEVVRQKAPGCHAEIDEQAGWIYLRQGDAATSSPAAAPPARAPLAASPSAGAPAPRREFSIGRWRSLQAKLALGVLAVAVVAGAAVWVKNTLLVIDPGKGAPVGASLRTEAHVATLIQTLEPYTPSLNRDHSKDRYRLSIFVVPLDGSSPYVVPVVGDLSPSTYALARILGSDGRTLWFDAAGLYGVDLASRALVRGADLRKANPSVDARWWEDTRGMEVDGRLRIVSRDRSQALAIEPATLKATAAAPQPPARPAFEPSVASYLAAGYCASPTSWLGLHSPAEIDSAFKPGRWLRCVERADEAKAMRRLFRGALEPSADGRNARILSMTPVGDAQYFTAAFLRRDDKSPPLRVADPDSVLMAFSSGPGPKATLVLARVDASGGIVWRADTGIDRFSLRQILPGEQAMAFVGTRPPVPDKVPEPLLVIVDNATGRTATHSLWR